MFSLFNHPSILNTCLTHLCAWWTRIDWNYCSLTHPHDLKCQTNFIIHFWNSSRVFLQSDLFKNIKWLAIYEWYTLRRNQNNRTPLFVCHRPTQDAWLNVKQTNAPLSCFAFPFNMNTHITHIRETIKLVKKERECVCTSINQHNIYPKEFKSPKPGETDLTKWPQL